MSDKRDILVVDDEDLICFVLTQLLKVHGFTVRTASRGDEALEMIAQQEPALVILDIRMPGLSGFDVLHRVKQINPQVPVILMTALSGVRDAVEAMKAGAFDYVSKPFDNNEMVATVRRALAAAEEASSIVATAPAVTMAELDPAFHALGGSARIAAAAFRAQQLAKDGQPCMITGEVGSGKRHLAQLMHLVSRREGPLVSVGCMGAAESVLRFDLYGGGSAVSQARPGKLHLAQQGTLLLEEIKEAPEGFQQSFARDIGNGHYAHPATGATVTIHAAVICTSSGAGAEALSDDLRHMMAGRVIELPPLRERKEDIPAIVERFLEDSSLEFGKRLNGIDDAAMDMLIGYDWPGNVHQLKSTVRRAVLHAKNRVRMDEIDLPSPVPAFNPLDMPQITVTNTPLKEQVRHHITELERQLLFETLQKTAWNKARASRILGITYKTMLKKVSEYGLEERRNVRRGAVRK